MGWRLKEMRERGSEYAAAEGKLLEWVRRRWGDELPGGELPDGMERVVRAHPAFQAWVLEYQQHQTITHADLTMLGRHVKRHTEDGVVEVDLLVDELGADPQEFVCRECEAEVSRGQGLCSPCREWLQTGG